MQRKLNWHIFTLTVVCIISISIIGCGDDDDSDSMVTPTNPQLIEVATTTPIDFAKEKAEINATFREFYRAFNDRDLNDLRKTWYSPSNNSDAFAVAWFVGGYVEQVDPAFGWVQVSATIEGLWTHTSTKNEKWTGSNSFSEFYIRRRAGDPNTLEASARSYSSYRNQGGSGSTFVYLVKLRHQDWKIHQVDSHTQNTLNNRKPLNTHAPPNPRITKYFNDPDTKVN